MGMFEDVMKSLDEIQSWTRGDQGETMRVHLPGKAPQELTFSEYVKQHHEDEPQEKPPLRIKTVRSYMSRSGWPFYLALDESGCWGLNMLLEDGVLRVLYRGEEIHRSREGDVFRKDRPPNLEEICAMAGLEIVEG